jgi:hypothetical protein
MPGSMITRCPGESDVSSFGAIGIGPVAVSGAVSVTTRRCCGAPYNETTSDEGPTNVRKRSQWGVSFTKRRSISG